MNYYNLIREAVVKAYPQESAEKHTARSKVINDVIKSKSDPVEKEHFFQQEKKKLSELCTKKKTGAMMYFIKAKEKCDAANKIKLITEGDGTKEKDMPASETKTSETQNATKNAVTTSVQYKPRAYTARAQQEAAANLADAERVVTELSTCRQRNDGELKKAIKNRNKAIKVLRQKQQNAVRQNKFQVKRKRALEELCQKDENLRKKLKLNETPGRPNTSVTQPGLIEAIVDISLRGSGAHERRREDTLKSCRTLDDLTKELKKQGFNLSRSGVYLRLIPRNWSTTEGKRHITTANVKLSRAQNNEHHQHDDTAFTKATYDYLMDLASVLGSHDVACLSQDDKAKVPLGLPAANKQSTIIMNMEYRIKLPDHDFVVASGHKLTPSVIAGLEIDSGKLHSAVTASGPTFIGIRSAKHDSSVAATHASDLRHLYADVDQFRNLLHHPDGTTKPILIILVDGGPDENPRYKETIKFACDNFVKLQLDALFISTNAPGRSAYNPVERRMAPLSRFLAGIILPYETFGSHLNSQGDTIDEELEKRNFQKAGEVLAEVWSESVIDGHPVVAEWRGGIAADQPEHEATEDWMAKHVRSSQYFLQIVKCTNDECCAPPRSSLRSILREGFFPNPLPVTNTNGLRFDGGGKFVSLFQRLSINVSPDGYTNEANMFGIGIPYDLCCPTVRDYVTNRTCNVCKLYFPSQVMVASHKKKLHPRTKVNEVPKIRPVRIAARRQRELMVIIAAGI